MKTKVNYANQVITQNQLKIVFEKKTGNDNKKTKRLTEIHPTKIHEIPPENIPQNQI